MNINEITFNVTGKESSYREKNYGKENDILHINLNGKDAITLIDEIKNGIDILNPDNNSTISFTLFGSLDKKTEHRENL